jgi:hypothetical protein
MRVPPVVPPGTTGFIPDIVIELLIAFFVGGAICALLLAIGDKILDAAFYKRGFIKNIYRFFGVTFMIMGPIAWGYTFYLVFS